jgi:hypothetical protein
MSWPLTRPHRLRLGTFDTPLKFLRFYNPTPFSQFKTSYSMDWDKWASNKPEPMDIVVAILEAIVVAAAVIGIGCYII